MTFKTWYVDIPYNKFISVISPPVLKIRQIGRKSSMVVGLVGFGLFVFCVMFQVLKGGNATTIFCTLISLVITQNLYAGLRKREVASFNKGNGMFWLESDASNTNINFERRLLSAIRAIQMTETSVNPEDTSYLYEVNIVYRDISRENILCNLNMTETRHNAEKIAEFLNVPILLALSLRTS